MEVASEIKLQKIVTSLLFFPWLFLLTYCDEASWQAVSYVRRVQGTGGEMGNLGPQAKSTPETGSV